MKIKITRYDKERNTCEGKVIDPDMSGGFVYDPHDRYGNPCVIDPFVGLAIKLTDKEYDDGKGFELVGKIYHVPNDVHIVGTMVPGEGEMVELTPEQIAAIKPTKLPTNCAAIRGGV